MNNDAIDKWTANLLDHNGVDGMSFHRIARVVRSYRDELFR